MRTSLTRLLATAAASAVLALPGVAGAASTIKQPNAHPSYAFDLEPHVLVHPFGELGIGPGFRATFTLAKEGFIAKVNDTVGLGVGADFFLWGHSGVWVPVVMQWNFWLSDKWSVFGEPGGGFVSGKKGGARPVLYAGGRYLFSDDLALVLRAGYPNASVGLSFLF